MVQNFFSKVRSRIYINEYIYQSHAVMNESEITQEAPA